MFGTNESNDSELKPELAALEAKLAGLAIAPVQVDRDTLMFEAGRAAALRHVEQSLTRGVAGTPRWFWPSATGLMAAACLLLSTMLVWQSDTETVADRSGTNTTEKVVIAPPTANDLRDVERLAARGGAHLWQTPPTSGYLEQRYIALTRDVGELPAHVRRDVGAASGTTAQPATARELLREFIPPSEPASASSS